MNYRQFKLREDIIGNSGLPSMKRDEIIEALASVIVDISNGTIGHYNWRKTENET
jgi:hypothetical protein